ncbi:MAG TPA: acyltransferase, partial [Thermoanaerobaculia bacterium]|nr:acyltransferase [Thermoanaerobaculia bacterium]
TVLRRFLLPRAWITLRAYLRFRCLVSPRAEVELSPHLSIGKGSCIGSFTKLKSADGPFTIGRNVDIATGCFLSSHTAGVAIGDDCLIGPNVSIIGNNYNYDDLETPIRLQAKTSAKGIRIGANVWIGAGSAILDGAEIGSGAILAPNSVVSGAIPENAVVQGNPGKVIFTRR